MAKKAGCKGGKHEGMEGRRYERMEEEMMGGKMKKPAAKKPFKKK